MKLHKYLNENNYWLNMYIPVYRFPSLNHFNLWGKILSSLFEEKSTQ